MTKLLDDYEKDADGSQQAEAYAEQIAEFQLSEFRFRERLITLLERISYRLEEIHDQVRQNSKGNSKQEH
ncbi:MAG: hypothetical protein CMB80_07960 [Flammeovirgaceae bacterium]|nr:hypothetical protein [Flammeovirgaceae bacterium]|tara:strand:+ start:8959 stop:9168 length:210 start_codon:yes stop_codon:yes gene_type:complete